MAKISNCELVRKGEVKWNRRADNKKKPHWFTRTVLSNTKRVELVVCSVCKTEYSFDYETGVGANDYNFCPNCGTKMGEDDGRG